MAIEIDKTTATLLWHEARRLRSTWSDVLSHVEPSLNARQYEAARELIRRHTNEQINRALRAAMEGE